MAGRALLHGGICRDARTSSSFRAMSSVEESSLKGLKCVTSMKLLMRPSTSATVSWSGAKLLCCR